MADNTNGAPVATNKTRKAVKAVKPAAVETKADDDETVTPAHFTTTITRTGDDRVQWAVTANEAHPTEIDGEVIGSGRAKAVTDALGRADGLILEECE